MAQLAVILLSLAINIPIQQLWKSRQRFDRFGCLRIIILHTMVIGVENNGKYLIWKLIDILCKNGSETSLTIILMQWSWLFLFYCIIYCLYNRNCTSLVKCKWNGQVLLYGWKMQCVHSTCYGIYNVDIDFHLLFLWINIYIFMLLKNDICILQTTSIKNIITVINHF